MALDGRSALGMDPMDAFLRQVFFFDTPALDLDSAGVVIRARRTQGKPDDSVVKLRPVVPSELPAEVREHKSFGVEVDALPGGYVCSGSFKGELGAGVVKPMRHRGREAARSCSTSTSGRSTPSTRPRGSVSTTSRSSARCLC